MSCRKDCKFLLACTVLLCATTALAQAPASIFQLDGSAAPDNLNCLYGTCDYWNLLNGAGGAGTVTQTQTPPTASGNWSARTFINGTASTDSFTGGGSKDFNLISQWKWSGSPTPNKDTLNAGYAAAYIQPDFDVVFGANRASPNGDANIGIWFFQQNIGLNANGSFSGAHQDHDIFVISAFTGGGGTSTISVYEWDHTCATGVKNPSAGQCADSNLRLLAAPSQVCGTSFYCAITNSASTTSTWGGALGSPLFFEGGVDITQALGQVGVTQLPCFTSFLEETRSSQSTSAVLKDFLLGSFPVCGLSVTKSCGTATVDSSGNFINYPVNFTVTNTGIGSLSGISVSDAVTYQANTSHNTGSPITIAVGTLGAGGQKIVSTTLTSSGSSVTDTGTVKDSTGTVSATSNTLTCQLDVATTLKVTKNCSTTLVAENGVVDVNVAFNGNICNTGSSSISGLALVDYQDSSSAQHSVSVNSTTLSPCTAVDSVTGLCTSPAGACTTYSGSYVPNSIDATGTLGRYFFNDEVAITSATPAVGALTKVSTTTSDPGNGSYGEATASCPICDKGECVP